MVRCPHLWYHGRMNEMPWREPNENDLITVELTVKEAKQLVLLKAYIGPDADQDSPFYWHLKDLELAFARINSGLRAAGLAAVGFAWEYEND